MASFQRWVLPLRSVSSQSPPVTVGRLAERRVVDLAAREHPPDRAIARAALEREHGLGHAGGERRRGGRLGIRDGDLIGGMRVLHRLRVASQIADRPFARH